MHRTNIEIKARCSEPDRIRAILRKKNADLRGVDEQVDFYFNVPEGRLKLRKGNIENSLIFYKRPNEAGPKKAEVCLYHTGSGSGLKEILTKALGLPVIVKKTREIYFIDNVKFHIDDVENLGSFMEIEATDTTGETDTDKLTKQCQLYMEILGIGKEELIDCSYSDMLAREEYCSSTGD